jgi:hypothetical protein
MYTCASRAASPSSSHSCFATTCAPTEDASEYEQLKRQLAERHRHDRTAYTQAKEDFTWKVIRRADRWAQVPGWAAPNSDA